MKIVATFLLILFCLIHLNVIAQDKDSIYKVGPFLFSAERGMKVDFIIKGKVLKERLSKGDTLYHDAKYIILGDRGKQTGGFIYKKFHLKYAFSQFKVSVYKGKLAHPNFNTDPAAKLYRTQIRYQCNHQGINFAGHYTVTEWGCGTECENIAVVDRISGKIFFSEIPYGQDEGFFGIKYRANSTMMIANSSNLEDYKGYELVRDYERVKILNWTGAEFKELPR